MPSYPSRRPADQSPVYSSPPKTDRAPPSSCPALPLPPSLPAPLAQPASLPSSPPSRRTRWLSWLHPPTSGRLLARSLPTVPPSKSLLAFFFSLSLLREFLI